MRDVSLWTEKVVMEMKRSRWTHMLLRKKNKGMC